VQVHKIKEGFRSSTDIKEGLNASRQYKGGI
jgi:hypothetical protein